MQNLRVICFDRPTCDVAPVDTYTAHEQELAKQVRSLYCICFREFTGNAAYGTRHMPQWDGDPTGLTGRRTNNVWIKIASKIAECQADPYVYMRAQFYSTRLDKPPAPNTCHGPAAVERYEAFHLQAKGDIQKKVESDVNQIQIHSLPFVVNLKWSQANALDYALRSPACGASPLVRYCFAAHAGLDETAAMYRGRALLQYMFQMSDYDDVLATHIPEELRVEAVACRNRIVRRD